MFLPSGPALSRYRVISTRYRTSANGVTDIAGEGSVRRTVGHRGQCSARRRADERVSQALVPWSQSSGWMLSDPLVVLASIRAEASGEVPTPMSRPPLPVSALTS
ncbi:hypothetical protein NORO109296_08885 [Nocardiopsis rhodophaea]